ncbi:MAG: hypothetical protein Q4F72_07340 [Desulfovibrionaceae bacterium]|nr:hypothetical protein [Desulfovibrionaceae bacterium]
MICQALAIAAAGSIVRKPFGMKPQNALLLGLFGATIVTSICSRSTACHVAAGLMLTGAVGYHVWKRRKAL